MLAYFSENALSKAGLIFREMSEYRKITVIF